MDSTVSATSFPHDIGAYECLYNSVLWGRLRYNVEDTTTNAQYGRWAFGTLQGTTVDDLLSIGKASTSDPDVKVSGILETGSF